MPLLNVRLDLLAFLLAGCVAAADEPTRAVDLQFQAAAFSDDALDDEILTVQWIESPGRGDVRALWSAEMYREGYGSLKCGLGVGGRLTDCEISRADPDDPSMHGLFKGLAARFKASDRFMRDHGSRADIVFLNLRVQNPAGRASAKRPCLAPLCHSIPGPPPPPAAD